MDSIHTLAWISSDYFGWNSGYAHLCEENYQGGFPLSHNFYVRSHVRKRRKRLGTRLSLTSPYKDISLSRRVLFVPEMPNLISVPMPLYWRVYNVTAHVCALFPLAPALIMFETIFFQGLGGRFEIQNFRNILRKISCLPASPRIFERLKNDIIAHF